MGKFYVYELIDPRTQHVFYVGKGQGQRKYAHAAEAKRGVHSRKCDRIREIWAAGQDITYHTVMECDEEADAYKAEADRIESWGLHCLTNVLPGGEVDLAFLAECREARAQREKIRRIRTLSAYPAFLGAVREWARITNNGQDQIVKITYAGFKGMCRALCLEMIPVLLQEMAEDSVSLALLARNGIALKKSDADSAAA